MTETAYDTTKPNLLRTLTSRLRDAPPFKRTFIEGILAGTIIVLMLFGWMVMRADRTAEKIQEQIPVEAVEITKAATPEEVAKAQADALPKSADALPTAPIDGLFERKNDLTLPIARLEDDMTPFQAYKRPFTAVAGRPLLSIVIADYGLSSTLSDESLKTLPPNVSFALTPYAEDALGWANKARADGHEIWLTLPMQTATASDESGPGALSLKASLQQNQDNLLTTLGAAIGYAGLVSQRGHAFTGDDIDMAPVLKQIFGRGLGFAESNPDYHFGEKFGADSGAPYVKGNVWIGDDLRGASIDRSLQEAEVIASKQGSVVVFVRPYPVVLKKVALWAQEAQERGLQLAPLSALAK